RWRSGKSEKTLPRKNPTSATETIRELIRPDDLRAVLTTLRHLKSIEILENGEPGSRLELNVAQGRFVGPNRLGDGV
ncbi:hypothetical protein, partial [Rhizobium johnstonii]|uniref:hypothetical protein n=1 Tax=Rhizobium johnstonii TaxID=3019933 RepID=UPI003F96CF36